MSPSRRRISLALVTGFVILVGVALLLSNHLNHLKPAEINRTTFEQIQVGMSRPEVESIIGGPPGFYGDQVHLHHRMIPFAPSKFGWTPIPEVAEDATMSSSDPEELIGEVDGLWIGSFLLLEEDATGAWQPTERHMVMACRIKFDTAGKVIDKRYYQGFGTRKLSRLDTWRNWIAEKLGLEP